MLKNLLLVLLVVCLIALRSWNDNHERQPIPDAGLEDMASQLDVLFDQVAIVRNSTDSGRLGYRIVENSDEPPGWRDEGRIE